MNVVSFKYAPFSPEEVCLLTIYQTQKNAHPYTCQCGRYLLPQTDGLFCPHCQLFQPWCLASHLETLAKLSQTTVADLLKIK